MEPRSLNSMFDTGFPARQVAYSLQLEYHLQNFKQHQKNRKRDMEKSSKLSMKSSIASQGGGFYTDIFFVR